MRPISLAMRSIAASGNRVRALVYPADDAEQAGRPVATRFARMRLTASFKHLSWREALRQPAPERDQRAEHPAAVVVAFAVQNAQHVLAR